MTETQVKENLNAYRIAKSDMRAALELIKQLEERSTATGSLAPKEVQVKTSLPLSAKFEAIIEDKIDLERIIIQEQAYLEEARALTQSMIDLCSNRQLRRILEYRYIHCLRMSEVAKVTHYSERAVYGMQRKAIKQITKSVHVSSV